MTAEVQALFAFGDAVELSGIASRVGASIIFWHEGREYLIDCKVYDVSEVEDE